MENDLFDILFNSSMILWNLPNERLRPSHLFRRKKFWKMLVISVDIEYWRLYENEGGTVFFSKIGIFRGIIRNYVTKNIFFSYFFFWNLLIWKILICFAWLWDIGKWKTFVKHIFRLKRNHELRLCLTLRSAFRNLNLN